jgi:hypothetical protein
VHDVLLIDLVGRGDHVLRQLWHPSPALRLDGQRLGEAAHLVVVRADRHGLVADEVPPSQRQAGQRRGLAGLSGSRHEHGATIPHRCASVQVEPPGLRGESRQVDAGHEHRQRDGQRHACQRTDFRAGEAPEAPV